MAKDTKKWIIANWKMNALSVDTVDRVMTLKGNLPSNMELKNLNYRVVLCPPISLINLVSTLCEDSMLMAGGQDCHPEANGAYTGAVSAEMLADVGASLVICGHSEHRARGDNDNLILAKAEAVIRAKLLPVICVGEDVHARAIGKELEIISNQLSHTVPKKAKNIIIAYEPVWAVGTGKAADQMEVTEIFRHIRRFMKSKFPHIRFALCYGGSVTSHNSNDLLNIEGCDGLLVGKASLDAQEFYKIIKPVL